MNGHINSFVIVFIPYIYIHTPAVEEGRAVNTVVSCWQVKWTPNSYLAVHMGLDLHTDADNLC